MSNDVWNYPLGFYFTVEFQWDSERTAASFWEVNGLDMNLGYDKDSLSEKDTSWIRLPSSVKNSDIQLKRPVEPLSEPITEWVKKCLTFSINGWIKPCLMIITLCNEHREIAASWQCARAYPIKWSLSSLDSNRSGLAIETLTLTYNRLERIR